MSTHHEYEFMLDVLMDRCEEQAEGVGGLKDVMAAFTLEELELFLEGQPYGFVPSFDIADNGDMVIRAKSVRTGKPVFQITEHSVDTTAYTSGMGALTIYETLTSLAMLDQFNASNLYKVVRILALFPSVQLDLSTLLVQEYDRSEDRLRFSLMGSGKRIRFVIHLGEMREEANLNAVLHARPTYNPEPIKGIVQ